ncbi:MAG TPA: cytochrome c [Candidatus Hydrogenedentes bacterium]|nr:cytochrome c [Candidatus Hydrogenedentota bacterium]
MKFYVSRGLAAAMLHLLLTETSHSELAYTTDIAPIITKHCAVCHYRDGSGPFPLLRYEDVLARAAMIGEVVRTRRMPPWHADPAVGRFKNERRLNDDEVNRITEWIASGAPRGDTQGFVQLPSFPSDWRIGRPDKIYTMPEDVSLPATGRIPYKQYEIPSGFSQDTWIDAIEIRPSTMMAVQHLIVKIKTDAPLHRRHGDFVGSGHPLLCSYTPGSEPVRFTDGKAILVPKHAKFLVQIHYTTAGKPQKDRTEIGVTIAEKQPRESVEWAVAEVYDFTIPPQVSDFRIATERSVPQDALVYALNAHMHYRGKSFEFIAHYPSGRNERLLRIPQYDFNWQTDYILERPVFLPKGTRIELIGHYDNSATNPRNPDPNATVRHGEDVWDEEFAGYMRVTWIADRTLVQPLLIANEAELREPPE